MATNKYSGFSLWGHVCVCVTCWLTYSVVKKSFHPHCVYEHYDPFLILCCIIESSDLIKFINIWTHPDIVITGVKPTCNSCIGTSKMAAGALLMIASLQHAHKKTIRTNLCHHFSICSAWSSAESGPFDMEQPGTIPRATVRTRARAHTHMRIYRHLM